jgi:hypothetical protein
MAAYSQKSLASTGTISQSRLNRRNREIRANDQKARAYRGNQRVFERSNRNASMAVNNGGNTLETSNYRGSISGKSVKKAKKQNAANNQKSSSFRGTISLKDQKKFKKQIATNNRKISTYRGSTSLKSIRSRDRRIEKNNKKIREFRGNIRVTKRPKGSYPGADYRGGKVVNSYQKKAKYRERMLKRLNKNKKLQQPSYQRQKYEKPTYDSRESEIWSKPGKPGAIKKK